MLVACYSCASIWDPCQQYLINKIEIIQHRAARFVLNHPWRKLQRDSITLMLSELQWPPLQTLRRNARLTLLYKIIHHHHKLFHISIIRRLPFHIPDQIIASSFNTINPKQMFIETHSFLRQSQNGTIYHL